MCGKLDLPCLKFDVARGCDADNSPSGFDIGIFRRISFHKHSTVLCVDVQVRSRVTNRFFLQCHCACFSSLLFLGFDLDKTLTRSNQPKTSRTYRRQDGVFGYGLQYLLFGVLPVFQSLNY